MAKITYVYHATDDQGGVTWHGQRFLPNKSIDTDNQALIDAASNHPHFEVSNAGEANSKAEVPKDQRAQRRGKREKEEEVVAEAGAYRVIHTGNDLHAVKMNDEVVAENLSREEAESQALSLAAHQPGGPTA